MKTVMRYGGVLCEPGTVARVDEQPAVPAGTNMQDKSAAIAEIHSLRRELGYTAAPLDDLEHESPTYLASRVDSLRKLRDEKVATRADALGRGDAAAVIRLDSVPTSDEVLTSRARVFHSGVPEADREAVAQRLAKRMAHERAADRFVAESVQQRMDSLDATAIPVTDGDRAMARMDPMGRKASDGRIEELARGFARKRLAEEHRRSILASLPPPPARPRLPQIGADQRYTTSTVTLEDVRSVLPSDEDVAQMRRERGLPEPTEHDRAMAAHREMTMNALAGRADSASTPWADKWKTGAGRYATRPLGRGRKGSSK